MPIYVNVDGAQKVLSDVYANIDGAQRRVTTMYANIDGSQKNLMGYKWAKYNPVYVQKTTKTDSVHLYSINGWYENFAYTTDSKLSFDTATGYFFGDAKQKVTGSFKGMDTESSSWNYLFLGYEDNTDGQIWYGLGSATIFKGIMGYYIPKNPTVAVDSDEKGATFSHTSNTINIYSSEPSTTEYGDFIEYVTSNDETAYPDNGLQDGYWYIRQ